MQRTEGGRQRGVESGGFEHCDVTLPYFSTPSQKKGRWWAGCELGSRGRLFTDRRMPVSHLFTLSPAAATRPRSPGQAMYVNHDRNKAAVRACIASNRMKQAASQHGEMGYCSQAHNPANPLLHKLPRKQHLTKAPTSTSTSTAKKNETQNSGNNHARPNHNEQIKPCLSRPVGLGHGRCWIRCQRQRWL